MAQPQKVPIVPQEAIARIRALSTPDRLLSLYEYGVEGCAQQSREQVSAVLVELIGTLDFEYGEIAEGFYRLYEYCLRKCLEGEFDQVAWILQDLRDTWSQAFSETPALDQVPIVSQPPQAD